jgi:nucleoside 2-deoxyribosyltransferase/DNA-directed RNA polymerase subunit RPC12/RpoP
MTKEEKCSICKNKVINRGLNKTYNSDYIDCNYCGKYYRFYGFEIDLELWTDKSKFYKVSSWIREQNDEFNNTPKINKEKFEQILNIREKTIQEKFDLMMLYLPRNKGLDKWNENFHLKCWIKDEREFGKLYQKSIDMNFTSGNIKYALKGTPSIILGDVTFDGLQYIESLEQPNKSSKNIFVAFNFEEGLSEIFNTHVKEAIEALGFNYTIVTQDTTTHDQAISDEIIAKLKSSRIVIADFTNHRNSVYFEAGFAMGMKIPIIWTCQEGHENDLSFDTRQYPHLVWRDGEDLGKQISDRIQVIV